MIGFRSALRPQQIAGRHIGWRPFVIEPDFSLVNLWKGIWRTFGMPPRMMASARRNAAPWSATGRFLPRPELSLPRVGILQPGIRVKSNRVDESKSALA